MFPFVLEEGLPINFGCFIPLLNRVIKDYRVYLICTRKFQYP